MSLLNAYKQKNTDEEWFKKYSTTGKSGRGKIFGYTNTNFRTQRAFVDHFQKFEAIEGVNRDNWKVASHLQEKDKQRVINLTSSKLFKKKREDIKTKKFLYQKTEKGKLYKFFIENIENFDDKEKWILNYVFLLNGHYSNTKNHIHEKTLFLLDKFIESVSILTKSNILKIAEDALTTDDKNDLMKKDFLYLMSFYTDWDFLEIYFNSTKKDKMDLYNYVIANLKEKNDRCVISKKYKNSGNYSFTQAKDEFKVFYQTVLLLDMHNMNIEDVIEFIFTDKIIDFLKKYDSNGIIKNIFLDFYNIEESTWVMEDMVVKTDESPQEYIDDTSIYGRKKTRQIFSAKKRQVKELSNHMCELDKINDCKYFTSKTTKKNYLEVHHIIPQEFRNEFQNSIEVFANYTSLCPYCHNLLHKALDRERIPSINFLFNQRKVRLELMNLKIDKDDLYDFYKIDIKRV